MTDQQRYDTIGAHGCDYMSTPNLDNLANEGAVFENCFITAPSCVPSRASLFSGYYPHTTGVVSNFQKWSRTWVESLRDAGYHCVNVGKMHTAPFEAPAGFNERYIVENKDRFLGRRYFFDEWDKALAAHGLVKQQRELYRQREDYKHRLGAFDWELPEDLQSDMFVGGFASWWLDKYPRTEPLFLQIGFPGPHPPYDPTPRFAEMYKDHGRFPKPVLADGEYDSQPSYMAIKRENDAVVDHDSILWNPDRTEEEVLRMRAYYYANVSMIDQRVGSILESLRRNGYLDNTVVLFTSDHGDLLGDHGLSEKWAMYDIVTRVPLIAWSPGRIPSGRRVGGLCQLFDLGPTILEMAGIEPPSSWEAQSLIPAMLGETEDMREFVYAEQGADRSMTGADFLTMVRNEKWKLVHISGTTEGQLFDLEADPDEVVNLWDRPEASEVKQSLLDNLREWLIASRVKTKDWAEGAR